MCRIRYNQIVSPQKESSTKKKKHQAILDLSIYLILILPSSNETPISQLIFTLVSLSLSQPAQADAFKNQKFEASQGNSIYLNEKINKQSNNKKNSTEKGIQKRIV